MVDIRDCKECGTYGYIESNGKCKDCCTPDLKFRLDIVSTKILKPEVMKSIGEVMDNETRLKHSPDVSNTEKKTDIDIGKWKVIVHGKDISNKYDSYQGPLHERVSEALQDTYDEVVRHYT